MFQVNVLALPEMTAATDMPSAVTVTDVGSGLVEELFAVATLLFPIGLVWLTFLYVDAA